MKQLITKLYGDYGKYINEYRSFPHINDGLKIVERRILYSLFEVAKTNLQKSAKVVGYCIGNLHPHGELSAYQTLVNMVNNGHVDSQGNFGSSEGISDDPPAAMRYTEVKMSKHILEDCFEYIKYMKFECLEMDSEPVNLPVKLPICLTGNYECQGMGFGYRTMIPCYEKKDLIKRLKWLLTKEGVEPIIKPKSGCSILSDNNTLRELLTTGRATITLKGKYDVVDTKNVVIRSFPSMRSFQSILNKFEKEISIDKSLGWRDNSTTKTEILFLILKARMLNIDELKTKLDSALSSTITYECNMCNEEGKVVLVSVDNMLLNIYKRYKDVVKVYLEDSINKIISNINEFIFIEKIKPLLSEQLKLNPNDIDKVMEYIKLKLSVEIDVIKIIFDKYTISRIFKIKTDTEQLEKEKKEFEIKLSNIDNYLWTEKYKI